MIITALLAVSAGLSEPSTALRAPAYPLVAHDPYFSVWSFGDTLTADWARHWSGSPMGMSGLARIDGKSYRWCGPEPRGVPAMDQKSVKVDAVTTVYTFEAGGVEVKVTFFSDVTPEDPVNASRTTAYVMVWASAPDGKAHDVSVYLDVSGEWVVHEAGQEVTWSREGGAVSMASVEQKVLGRVGDGTRIDWGRLVLSPPEGKGAATVAGHTASREGFAKDGSLAKEEARKPRRANDDWPVMAAASPVAVGGNPVVFSLGYDDGKSIELLGKPLPAAWKAAGGDMMLGDGKAVRRLAWAETFAEGLTRSAEKFGGKYAAVVALANRQVLAGNKIVQDGKNLAMFPKENSSNGCIATVDVIYPASPYFLYHSPEMLKAQLRPLMDYSASPKWKFPFAPHDLGTYPKANGQVYGGGEKTEENQMPVEESGNMLIMLAALAKVERSAEFSRPYLPVLAKWAEYLAKHGLDPENQLCTDDFAGHLARNANLSAKTVVALGGYAQILAACGDTAGSEKWMTTAKDFARKWMDMARDGDGTVLVFGKPGTWSQKYNLVWDRVLGLNLFPQEVFDREVAVYKGKAQKYGIPLDSRKMYTKLDWTVWSACLSGKRADFDAIMGPVYTWVNETPTRVPLSDWYETDNGRQTGFQARTVVGGIWMPMLMEKMGVGLK